VLPHSLSPRCERPSRGPRRACSGRAARVSRRRRLALASVAKRQRREVDQARLLPREGASAASRGWGVGAYPFARPVPPCDYSPAASSASASAPAAFATAAYAATRSARLSPAPAWLRRSTATSKRAHNPSGPRRPVRGRSSYGGRARSDPSTGRQASPASSARACVARIVSAASESARRRPRKPASGGASSCERIAPAHADWALRTALQASSFVLGARPSRRVSGTSLTPRSYRTERQLRTSTRRIARRTPHLPQESVGRKEPQTDTYGSTNVVSSPDADDA
jgi:hypothetical protein